MVVSTSINLVPAEQKKECDNLKYNCTLMSFVFSAAIINNTQVLIVFKYVPLDSKPKQLPFQFSSDVCNCFCCTLLQQKSVNNNNNNNSVNNSLNNISYPISLKLHLYLTCCCYPSDMSRSALVQVRCQGCCWRPEHRELSGLSCPLVASEGWGGRGVTLLADIPNPGGAHQGKRQTQAVLLAEHLPSALLLKLESVGQRKQF